MLLTFLSGRVPLTKAITFTPGEGAYRFTQYPLIQRVTSQTEQCSGMEHLAALLKEHGALGHCLLKGSLDQPLKDESRAGHSVEEPHDWIVFDFDKVAMPPTHEGALEAIRHYLPPACQGVDCVIQLSASAFNPTTKTLSCHIYMQLTRPASTEQLKAWIEHINFNSPLLSELRLTDSELSLHFPLDRSVVTPSRLIYIASPRCIGFKPELDSPIRFIPGARKTLELPKFIPLGPELIRAKVEELRKSAGLKPLSTNTVTKDGVEFLTGVGECVVHDLQKSGSDYLRFNLNGGNSLAYYVDLRKPHIIGNFKGEPFLYTREVAPKFFEALQKATRTSSPPPRIGEFVEPFAIYASNRGSSVFVGYYDRETDELRLEKSTENAAASWMLSFGLPLKGRLPHADLVYDMNSTHRFEPGYSLINLYRQTDFIKEWGDVKKTHADILRLETACPVIRRVMYHALGSSHEALGYFVNWLAHIFQTRKRAETAWLLHGVEGTGKGTLVDKVLRPLFGESSVTQVLFDLIDTKFNAFLEGKLFVVVNEAEKARSHDTENMMAKLRDWITEPRVQINVKGQTERETVNNANFIVCSNKLNSVKFEHHDRRYNVAEYQTERLVFDPNEYAIIEQSEELMKLAEFLGTWIVDKQKLLKPYQGSAKERIFEATHSVVARVARAVIAGEVAYFHDNRPLDVQLKSDFSGRILPVAEFDQLIYEMARGTLSVLRKEDLYVLFRVICPDPKQFPDTSAEQRRLLNSLGLVPATKSTMWDKRLGKSVHGIKAPEWQLTPELRSQIIEEYEKKYASMPENVRKLR
jgi:hypothetical protein